MTRFRRSTERPNFGVLDLFAGCGGLTDGFTSASHKDARFVSVGAVELDPSAAATYASNFGAHVYKGDTPIRSATDCSRQTS
jgi:site-specific DNA-cytosine methylase